MEIPLEILRAILNHAETVLNFTELLRLRLVNSVFDRELLSRLFTDHRSLRAPLSQYKNLPSNRSYRFINGNIWNVAPASLRKRYIHYRLEAHTSNPSLFAYVFLPVYRRWLLDLDIALDNVTEKNRVLDDLLSLVTCSKLAGAVIAHDSRKTQIMIERTFPVSASARELVRQEQTDFELEFARFAFTVLNDESQAVQILERGINLKRQSLCFGSSLFEFCIRRGSIDLLRQILDKDTSLVHAEKRPYKFFAAAAERRDSGRECVDLLLHRSRPMENFHQRKPFLKSLITKAGKLGHLPVVQGVLDWFEEHWQPSASHSTLPEDPLVAAKEATLWLNDPKCRARLIQSTYSKILKSTRDGGTKTASSRDIFFTKPDIELLHLLLRNGIDVNDNGRSQTAYTPFDRAIQRGMMDWVETMLQAGAGHGRTYYHALNYAHDAGIVDELMAAVQKYGHVLVRIPDEHWTWFSEKWNGGTYWISWGQKKNPAT